jgi:hypothetical protein
MGRKPKGPLLVLQHEQEAFEARMRSKRALIGLRLEKMVPAELSNWVSETGVIAWILKLNGAYARYSPDNFADYGFTDMQDCIAKLGLLKEAWDGVIYVCVTMEPKEQQVEVTFNPM